MRDCICILFVRLQESVKANKAVTVLTYLHGVAEVQKAIKDITAEGNDIDLIELRSLKPLDLDTIKQSLQRTHKVRFSCQSLCRCRINKHVCFTLVLASYTVRFVHPDAHMLTDQSIDFVLWQD